MPPPSAPLGETIPASRKRARKLTGSARAALMSFSARFRRSPVAVPLLPLRSMPTARREDIIRPNFAMRLCRICQGRSNAELTSRLFPRHSLSWIRHKCWLRVVLLAYRQNIDRLLDTRAYAKVWTFRKRASEDAPQPSPLFGAAIKVDLPVFDLAGLAHPLFAVLLLFEQIFSSGFYAWDQTGTRRRCRRLQRALRRTFRREQGRVGGR